MDDQQPTPSDDSVTTGFSDTEKALGVVAAVHSPLTAVAVTSALLVTEQDPVRRTQLDRFRSIVLSAWGVAALAGAAALAAVGLLSAVASEDTDGVDGTGGSQCRGGYVTTEPERVTYESVDGKHWTATYPCLNGAVTRVPVPRDMVPGG